MSRHLVIGLMGLCLGLAAGCASTQAANAPTRMVASGGRLVVEVEGHGSVELGPKACDANRCEVEWDQVADPVLVAEAAPGWRFERWEAPDATPSDPSFSDPSRGKVYRAVFVQRAETARRDGNATE